LLAERENNLHLSRVMKGVNEGHDTYNEKKGDINPTKT
jgi:hypothetical protein